VVGNLYSRDGVNAILRNVLANPVIRYIVLCGKPVTDSGAALKALLDSGVDSNWRVIGNGAQVDREIPEEAIERFRRNVEVVDLQGLTAPDEVRKAMAALEERPPFGLPEVFPEAERATDRYPAESAGCVVRGNTIAETWIRLVFHIMNFGRVTATDYGVRQQELIGVLAVVAGDPGRDAGIPEWMPVKGSEVEEYAAEFVTPQEPRDIGYSYGHRLIAYWNVNQIESMVSDLRRSKVSRRAVASLWDPRVDARSEDPPCIDVIQIIVRDDRLVMSAYIRSNDIYRAWVQNAYGLRRLQSTLGDKVGAQIGDLMTFSQSAHVYEDCWSDARRVLAEQQHGVVLPRRFGEDPRGSFVIRVDQGSIFVDHYSPAGDKLRTLSGRTARQLEGLLAPFISLPEHALYLGRELERAARAAGKGRPYEQDQTAQDLVNGDRPPGGGPE
jgi:thymidylate synthase